MKTTRYFAAIALALASFGASSQIPTETLESGNYGILATHNHNGYGSALSNAVTDRCTEISRHLMVAWIKTPSKTGWSCYTTFEDFVIFVNPHTEEMSIGYMDLYRLTEFGRQMRDHLIKESLRK